MVEEGKRAYNALLTLLQDESKPLKKSKKDQTETVLKPSEVNQVAEVEGLDETQTAEDEDEDNDEEDDEIQVNDDNEGDKLDPFETHFADPPEFDAPKSSKSWKSEPVSQLPHLGDRSILQVPADPETKASTQPAQFHTELKPLKQKTALAKIKHRLQAPFQRANGDLTTLQTELASPLFNYKDVFLTNRTWNNCDQLLNMVTLHLINHIYKTRDRVLKNTARLKDFEKTQKEKRIKSFTKEKNQNESENENENEEKNEEKDHDQNQEEDQEGTDEEPDLRDQGFTRPKVLVLLPTRHACYELIERINKISGLAQSENRKRFKEAFYQKSVDLTTKPEDFQNTFAGNTNEVFCLGVKFTRQALKLYSSFYASDLIVASPLGLRLVVDKKDYDFLSSIELCVCDQLENSAQQSWANVKHVFDKLNLIPKNPHDCDFSRVREWYLSDKAKFLRQTVLLSSYATPEMVSLYNKQCLNVAGKFRSRAEIPGVLSDLKIHIRQVFTRVSVSSFLQDSQQRLTHFTSTLLPGLMRGAQSDGILIVAPTYTDFVVLRNYLEKNDYSYVSLSEYTTPSQLGRGRTYFANGKAKIMLYSARLHHYRRYSIKGVRNVVFYGLPDNPIFYGEFVRVLARTVLEQQVDPDLLKVNVLFTKWDALKLERIVGTKRMAALIEGINDTHEFY